MVSRTAVVFVIGCIAVAGCQRAQESAPTSKPGATDVGAVTRQVHDYSAADLSSPSLFGTDEIPAGRHVL
jgi:hypothetical protein